MFVERERLISLPREDQNPRVNNAGPINGITIKVISIKSKNET